MESLFVRSWWVPALRGAAGIVFGVLAVAWPGLTLLTLVALYAMLAGIASLAGSLRHQHDEDDWWVALLLGLASIGAGALAVLNPGPTALVLVLLMGANALVTGVLDIVAAVRLRRAHVRNAATLTEPSTTHGAIRPSQRKAQIGVVVLQCA